MTIILEPGESVTITGPNLNVQIISPESITVESSPEPILTGANWVPNPLLTGPDGNKSVAGWVFEKGYFYDCVKDPANCGLHGPLVAPRAKYPSPTGTWYLQADRDYIANDPNRPTRNNTWPLLPVMPVDKAWIGFPAGAYDPARGLVFSWEEAGHIRELSGSDEDGSCWTTLTGRDVSGEWYNLHIQFGLSAAWGAGHSSPPETIRFTLPNVPPGLVELRIEVEAYLRGYNAGILWGAFYCGAA